MMPNKQIIQNTESFDVTAVRADFPALSETVHGKPVVFLDSGASAQKPLAVIDAMDHVMRCHYANVHRGVYTFSQKTTMAFEAARVNVADFINAPSDKNIVFTHNATEAINLVAASWGQRLKAGDEIILTTLEHHANIIPWHFLVEKYGAVLKVVPLNEEGALDIEAYQGLLSEKTKMVAITQMSNVTGEIVPVADMIKQAKAVGADVLIDGSQAIVHMDIDVQALGCDFYVFTGHKLYGPSGIGVLYGTMDALNGMPPYQGGGEMIDVVSFDKVTYKEAPYRFEAGTPAIVEAIGLGAAVDYVSGLDMAGAHAHEDALLKSMEDQISDIDGVTVYSMGAKQRSGILSFTIKGIHPHDIGTLLDQMGVAIRSGHHCAQPLLQALGVPSTVRASLGMYNTQNDVDAFIEALHKVKKIFG